MPPKKEPQLPTSPPPPPGDLPQRIPFESLPKEEINVIRQFNETALSRGKATVTKNFKETLHSIYRKCGMIEVFQKLAFETERQIDDQCSRYRDELEAIKDTASGEDFLILYTAQYSCMKVAVLQLGKVQTDARIAFYNYVSSLDIPDWKERYDVCRNVAVNYWPHFSFTFEAFVVRPHLSALTRRIVQRLDLIRQNPTKEAITNPGPCVVAVNSFVALELYDNLLRLQLHMAASVFYARQARQLDPNISLTDLMAYISKIQSIESKIRQYQIPSSDRKRMEGAALKPLTMPFTDDYVRRNVMPLIKTEFNRVKRVFDFLHQHKASSRLGFMVGDYLLSVAPTFLVDGEQAPDPTTTSLPEYIEKVKRYAKTLSEHFRLFAKLYPGTRMDWDAEEAFLLLKQRLERFIKSQDFIGRITTEVSKQLNELFDSSSDLTQKLDSPAFKASKMLLKMELFGDAIDSDLSANMAAYYKGVIVELKKSRTLVELAITLRTKLTREMPFLDGQFSQYGFMYSAVKKALSETLDETYLKTHLTRFFEDVVTHNTPQYEVMAQLSVVVDCIKRYHADCLPVLYHAIIAGHRRQVPVLASPVNIHALMPHMGALGAFLNKFNYIWFNIALREKEEHRKALAQLIIDQDLIEPVIVEVIKEIDEHRRPLEKPREPHFPSATPGLVALRFYLGIEPLFDQLISRLVSSGFTDYYRRMTEEMKGEKRCLVEVVKWLTGQLRQEKTYLHTQFAHHEYIRLYPEVRNTLAASLTDEYLSAGVKALFGANSKEKLLRHFAVLWVNLKELKETLLSTFFTALMNCLKERTILTTTDNQDHNYVNNHVDSLIVQVNEMVKHMRQFDRAFPGEPRYKEAVGRAISDLIYAHHPRASIRAFPHNLANFYREVAKKLCKRDKSERQEGRRMLERTKLALENCPEKDRFRIFYSRKLVNFLLLDENANQASFAVEKKLVKKIGSAFDGSTEDSFEVAKKLSMIGEVEECKELCDKFNKLETEELDITGMLFNAKVLRLQVWPLIARPDFTLKLPSQLESVLGRFEPFYRSYFINAERPNLKRKLTWNHELSRGTVELKYTSKPYTATMATSLLVILLQFESVERLTVAQLQENTGLSETEINRHLKCLVGNHLLFRDDPSPPGTSSSSNSEHIPKRAKTAPNRFDGVASFQPSTLVYLNWQFVNKNSRFTLLLLPPSSVNDSASSISSSSPSVSAFNPQHKLEAAIARLMKRKGKLTFEQITVEVDPLLASTFVLEPGLIKKAIEKLLAQDYLKQDDDGTYLYVP